MAEKEKQSTLEEYKSLQGKLLLADPRFENAVILICVHDQNSAMGLVVNKTLADIKFSHMLEELGIVSNIQLDIDDKNIPIMSGGPVEAGRGFLLHSHEFNAPETIKIDEQFSVTGTVKAIEKIANGQGPNHVLLILGYAGWGSGQLDKELQQNAWLVAEPSFDVLFETTPQNKWAAAMHTIGINPSLLSTHAGNA